MATSSSTAVMRVGFVGAGKMAAALARGFIEGKAVATASHVAASCPEQDKHLLEDFEQMGCKTTHCNSTLVSKSDVVVLAVKPNVVAKVLDELRTSLVEDTSKKILVSIAAGIGLTQLQNATHEEAKVVRLMPNTPCIVREGASVYCRGQAATAEDGAAVKRLFDAVGTCLEVPESMIDAITAVSASGPAYMYLIIEAMADGAVKQGLPRELAYRLAAQTMVGSGRMVLSTKSHPAVLKDQVCSPGGTTIAALDVLEKAGLRTSMMQAVEAATKRCRELASASKM